MDLYDYIQKFSKTIANFFNIVFIWYLFIWYIKKKGMNKFIFEI